MGRYEARVVWRRAADGTFRDNRYTRAHEWQFDGGARVRASASPLHVPAPFADPAAVDPEEAFVAALSSCHMLFFLWLAAQRGFEVFSYDDSAVGLMGKNHDGRESITKVTLRPQIVFDGSKRPTDADVEVLHHESHDRCYIANSVRTQVFVEGQAEGTKHLYGEQKR